MGSVVLMRFKCTRCNHSFMAYTKAIVMRTYKEDTALEITYTEYNIITEYQTFTEKDKEMMRVEDNGKIIIFNTPIEDKLECMKCRTHGDLMNYAR